MSHIVVTTLDQILERFEVRTKHLIKFVFCLVEPDAGQDPPSKKFQCDSCDYTTTRAYHLRQHKESKHEGIIYPCDQCDYAATRASHLKKHKEFKHEGIGYLCDHCEYSVVNILLHFAIFSVESSLIFFVPSLPFSFPSLFLTPFVVIPFSHSLSLLPRLIFFPFSLGLPSFPFPSSPPFDFLPFLFGPSSHLAFS